MTYLTSARCGEFFWRRSFKKETSSPKSLCEMHVASKSNLTGAHLHLFPILSIQSPKTGVTQAPPFLAPWIWIKPSQLLTTIWPHATFLALNPGQNCLQTFSKSNLGRRSIAGCRCSVTRKLNTYFLLSRLLQFPNINLSRCHTHLVTKTNGG